MPPLLPLSTSSIRFLLISLLMFLSASSLASLSPITLDNHNIRTALGNHALYLEDIDGVYSIHDIINLDNSDFKLLTEESLNKGFTRSTYWMKFSVLDQTDDNKSQDWKFEIAYPLLDYIDLYIIDGSDKVEHIQMGDHYPYHQRAADYRNFIALITLADNEKKDIYLRVNTSSSMQIPALIWHPDYFFEARSGEQYFLGLFYGMMLAMFFYNFFLWLTIRDVSYLWYIGYLASFIFLQATTNGLSYQYLWPNSPGLANIASPISISLVGFLAAGFTRSFLHTKQFHSTSDTLLRIVMAMSLVLLGLSFVIDLASVMMLAKVVIVTLLLFILYVSIDILLRGYRQARFFLAAWVSLLVGGLFTIGMMMGIFPNTFLMTHASKIGSIIEVILLSFALADRIKMNEQEKNQIERRAKQDLKQSSLKLQENSRLKDEFLATISHEFRTPLNGILGSLELVQQDDNNNSSNQNIKTARASADEMLYLVDQVLSYTELQSGHFTANNSTVKLDGLLAKIENYMDYRCKGKGLEFSINNNALNPQFITTDKKHTFQAISPILDNAIKFTDQGKIDLSVDVTSSGNQSFLILQVTDSGIGIAEDKRESILEADGSFSRQFGGLGIGLSLVNALCAKMGGNISIESEVDSGTRVKLSLPIEIPQQVIAPDQNSSKNPQQNSPRARVLIVEDNHINKVVLKTMLIKLNLETYTADHGAKALELLEQLQSEGKKIDIILMDCQMPVMDGFTATQRIRTANKAYSNTPIIAITANALSSDRERCLQAGMSDYLSKPFHFDDIQGKLQYWLPNK